LLYDESIESDIVINLKIVEQEVIILHKVDWNVKSGIGILGQRCMESNSLEEVHVVNLFNELFLSQIINNLLLFAFEESLDGLTLNSFASHL
jgi:hypothetical protein